MKKYNQKDEALVQVGASISAFMNAHEIIMKEAANSCNYSNAAGYFNIITGLEMALNCIGDYFGSDGTPTKNRRASFASAVNTRLDDIREAEIKLQEEDRYNDLRSREGTLDD